jgi:hypothetical protein
LILSEVRRVKSFLFGRAATLSLVGSIGVTACFVPQNRHEAVVAKLHDEEAARRNAEAELARARAELARIDESLRTKEQSLIAREGDLAKSALDTERVATERDDAVALVEQLRGELARVGDNLREYSEEKRGLETALSEAELRAKEVDRRAQEIERRMLIVRDVTLGVAELVAAGKATVTAVDAKTIVRFDARDLFAAGTDKPDTRALDRLGAVLASEKGIVVEVADRTGEDVSPEDRAVRLESVANALSAAGVERARIRTAAPEPRVDPGALGVGADVRVAAKDGVSADAGQSATKQPAEPEKPVEKGTFRDGPGSIQIAIDAEP